MHIFRKLIFIAFDIIVLIILVNWICRYLGLDVQQVVDFFKPLFNEIIHILQSLKGIAATT